MSVLVALLLPASAQEGPGLAGQVVDEGGRPVEGAVATLDREPADGQPEATAETSAFGFFRMAVAVPGVHRLRLSHGGFVPWEQTVDLANAGRIRQRWVLVPLPGPNRFDVFVQVNDVTTGLELGGVPVVAERFARRDDASPAESTALVTDREGAGVWRGLLPGFYRFRANEPGAGRTPRPKWQAHSTLGGPEDLEELVDARAITFHLKPDTQALEVRVSGYDAVRQAANAPLKDIVVEATGVDPGDTRREVLPVQSTVTDAEGRARFTGLPAVAYRVRTKRPGYVPLERIVMPDAAGNLAGQELGLALHPTHLFVKARHGYRDSNLVHGVSFVLEGVPGSNTEGIRRVQTTYPPIRDARIFQNLLPGRYRVQVDGPGFGVNGVRPHFQGAATVEVPLGDPVRGGYSDADLPLATVPGVVRGRLFAAEAQGGIEFRNETGGRPVYQARAAKGIEFVEYAGDGFLPEDQRVFVVEADAAGEFAVHLPPGRYGVRIAGLTNHWGSHVAMRDTSGATAALVQGWPFAEPWPHSGAPPRNGTPADGLPLLVPSGREYGLDLFVRRQAVTIRGVVADGTRVDELGPNQGVLDPRPMTRLPGVFPILGGYRELVAGPGRATLQPAQGDPVTTSFRESTPRGNSAPDVIFEFPGVSPGSYSVTLAHPRRTFRHDAGIPSVVTVPRWNAPGVLPETDPNLPGFVAPLTTVTLPGTFVGGQARSRAVIRWDLRFWNETQGRYDVAPVQVADGGAPPSWMPLFQPDYAPGLVFVNQGMPGQDRLSFPLGGFTYWRGFQVGESLFWYRNHVDDGASVTHVIHVGGPDHSATALPPSLRFDLTLRAQPEDDPTTLIPGMRFTNTVSGLVHTNGQVIPGFEGATGFNTGGPGWQFRSVQSEFSNPSAPSLRLTYRYTRALSVRGGVTNAVTGTPVTGARVQVRERYGNVVSGGELVTSTNGTFALQVPLAQAQVVFVDVTAPGFFPWRRRHVPTDAVAPPEAPANLTLNVGARLEPLPAPGVLEVVHDRRGLFLPGVTRAGDEGDYAPEQALDALTSRWLATTLARSNAIAVVGFDGASGDGTPTTTLELPDAIAEVWLIDPRAYTNSPFVGPAIPLPPPANPLEVQGRQRWLSGIRTNALLQVFAQPVREFSVPNELGEVRATNRFRVSDLPPGEFRPLTVAVTRRGAVGVLDAYGDATRAGLLTGAEVPRWFSGVTDAMALAATRGGGMVSPESVLPEGMLVPEREFTARIGHDDEGYLDYAYELRALWSESVPTPFAGLLTLAPARFGLDFEIGLKLGARGRERRMFFEGAADISRTEISLRRFLPPRWELLEEPTLSLNGTASLGLARTYPPAHDPYEFEMVSRVGGGLELKTLLDFTPLVRHLGHPGKVIAALDDTGLLQVRGTLDVRFGLDSVRVWRTRFPEARSTESTTDPDPHVLRRHAFGGTEEIRGVERTNHFDLCYGTGFGLRIGLGSDRAHARAGLRLVGAPCGGRPSATFRRNPDGDWPYLKLVQGRFAAELEIGLDLWITERELSWEWDVLSFEHQLGTEPVFVSSPVRTATRVVTPAQASPGVFSPMSSNLVARLLAASRHTVASAPDGSQALVYSDADGAGGMVARFVRRLPDRSWTSPVVVGQAAGIIDVSVATLPGNAWLVVWSQIRAEDVNQPFPTSELRFVRSRSDGNGWTDPAVVAGLPDVAHRLRLIPMGAGAGLLFLRTDDGPMSVRHGLAGATFSGDAWSPVTTLVPNEGVLREFVALGTGQAVLAVHARPDGTLAEWLWNGVSAPRFAPVPDATGAGMALALDAAGNAYLVAASTNGVWNLHRRDAGSGSWTKLRPLPGTIRPVGAATLALTGVGGYEVLHLGWDSDAVTDGLRGAVLDLRGDVLVPPFNIAPSGAGTYHDLRFVRWPDGEGTLLARYSERDGTALRQFPMVPTLSFPVRLEAVAWRSAGGFELRLASGPSGDYRLQTSEDLVRWTDLDLLRAVTPPHRILVPARPLDRGRFYRVVAP